MATARAHGLPAVGVMETDTRFGCPDFGLERQRALTGGGAGGPVSEHAAANVELLASTCFIPRRTQKHELKGYLDEILKQGLGIGT